VVKAPRKNPVRGHRTFCARSSATGGVADSLDEAKAAFRAAGERLL
jgi:hypothetical protein